MGNAGFASASAGDPKAGIHLGLQARDNAFPIDSEQAAAIDPSCIMTVKPEALTKVGAHEDASCQIMRHAHMCRQGDCEEIAVHVQGTRAPLACLLSHEASVSSHFPPLASTAGSCSRAAATEELKVGRDRIVLHGRVTQGTHPAGHMSSLFLAHMRSRCTRSCSQTACPDRFLPHFFRDDFCVCPY